MSCHDKHPNHAHADHVHGEGCGHTAIRHGDHTDYLHEGHLHHAHDDHVHDCKVEVGGANPSDCAAGQHDCGAHAGGHVHGPDCEHEAVPHGDHVCYLVEGHLHHPHSGHCDDHGPVQVI